METKKSLRKALPTVDIKGKPYVMVSERIKWFREVCPFGAIETIINHLDDTQVVMIARVYPNKKDNPHWFAEGVAQEYIGSGINKLSWAEVCNTSAIGRAMAFLGIGIDHGIASADEVRSVVNQVYYPNNDEIGEYAKLLESDYYKGNKKKMNDWWKKLVSKDQVVEGLRLMSKQVNDYENKKNNKKVEVKDGSK